MKNQWRLYLGLFFTFMMIVFAILIVIFGVWQFDSFTFLLDESVKTIMKQ